MRIIEVQTIRNVFISLKFYWIFDDFNCNTNHGSDFSNNILAHGFCSIAVPFIAFTILYDSGFSFVDNLGFIDGLFQHFIGIVFDFFSRWLHNFFLCLLNNIFVGSKIRREFLFDHISWLYGELFDFVVKGSCERLKWVENFSYDSLLLKFFFDECLLEFVDFVEWMNLWEVCKFVYKLDRVAR